MDKSDSFILLSLTCLISCNVMAPSRRFIHRALSWRLVQRTSKGTGSQSPAWEEAPLLCRREAALLLLRALRQQGAVPCPISWSQSIHISWRRSGLQHPQTGETHATLQVPFVMDGIVLNTLHHVFSLHFSVLRLNDSQGTDCDLTFLSFQDLCSPGHVFYCYIPDWGPIKQVSSEASQSRNMICWS